MSRTQEKVAIVNNKGSLSIKEICRAAAWDAGCKSAKENGHIIWNEDDYNIAVKAYETLFNVEKKGE